MIRYPDTRATSAELLRLALPLMSRHEAALHPISYAVWYEYVSGRNAELKAAVDRAQAGSTALDDSAIEDLYGRFIAERDAAAAVRMQSGLERIVSDMTQQVAAAGQEADRFGRSLGACQETLKNGVDPQSLEAIVNTLVAETQRMHESAAELGDRLKEGTREVGQLRAELARARGEAHTDPLTGVMNRRGLEHALAEMRAGTGGLAGLCLVVVDIDHFKRCNDTYGHLFGDRVIRAVAQVFLRLVRGEDNVVRIGGEEFAILLPRTQLNDACAQAERIRETVKVGKIKRMETGELVGNISVSLGVAEYCSGESFEDLMARADAALYASKNGGRNRVSVAEAPGSASGARTAVRATPAGRELAQAGVAAL